ncbi:MAG: reverse transcriptase domain-containing protein, partial [Aeromonas sp.]
MQEHIDRIENIKEQDLLTWFSNFQNISSLCGWSEETKFATVRALVTINLQPHIAACKTLNDIQFTLLRLKYPPEDSFRYTTEISHIKQENYPRITDYYNELNECITILGCCKAWNQTQTNFKIEEIFYQNLATCTQIELARQGVNNIKDALSVIHQTEEILIKTFKPEKYKGQESKDSKKMNNHDFKQKWCSFHKVNSHSTDECRSKPDNTTKERHNKTFSLIDKRPQIGVIKLPIEINNVAANAIIDSGSSYSYIPESRVKEMNLKAQHHSPINSETADGRTIEVNKITNTEMSFKEIPNAAYKLKAFILQTSGSDLILGSDFLTANYVIINYSVPFISIDGHEVEIADSKQTDILSPDNCLRDKTRILKIETDSNKRLESIVGIAKQKNPKLGTIKGVFHEISTIPHKPIQSRGYPIPQKHRDKTLAELDLLLSQNIIRPSNSKYASPAYPILKRNDEIRLVVDYRKVNCITTKEIFPIQGIQEQLVDLQGSKFFSTIDLKSGYYQILMHPNSIQYTAFVIAGRHYEFLRMPFGLSNAPMTFQRVMTHTFTDMKFVRVYLDDILIFSQSIEDHIIHVEAVINRLIENGISVNFEKSSFGKTEIRYLGQVISEEGIKADLSRVNTSLINSEPKTKKQLMSLIGYINWFRNYIPNLSSKISPITEKLKVGGTFKWKDADVKITEEILEIIKSNILLNYPDYSKTFELYCDASENGLGAMLKQGASIIGLFSKKLTTAQVKYNIMEKEVLAIIFALEHFKQIIFGYKIDVYTDNLNNTFQENINQRRCQRWQILIQEYNINLKYIKGKTNEIADFNSRIFLNITTIYSENEPLISMHDLKNFNTPSKQEKIQFKLTLDNGVYKDEKQKIFVPNEAKFEFIRYIHNKLGHPGSVKLINTISNEIFSENLSNTIKKVSKNCLSCQKNKIINVKYGKTSGYIVPENPFEIISSDIVGPFNYKEYKTEFTQNFYLITVTDHFSRFTKVFAAQNITSYEIVQVISSWSTLFKKPKILVTDQGRQYMACNTKKFLYQNEIQHNYTSAYNPTGNAVSERVNGSINLIMRIYKNCNIAEILKLIHNRLNNTWHRILKTTPHCVITRYSNLTCLKNKQTVDYESIKMRNTSNQSENEEKTNLKRKNIVYAIGDQILLKNQNPKKNQERYLGPFKIISKSRNTLTIENETQKMVVNIKNVKLFFKDGEDVAARQFKSNQLITDFDAKLTVQSKPNHEGQLIGNHQNYLNATKHSP